MPAGTVILPWMDTTRSWRKRHAGDAFTLEEEFIDHGCDHVDRIPACGQKSLDLAGIGIAIRLCAWPANRWTTRCVQHAEHDSRGIDRTPHEATKRIDLADHLPLRETADRRIAAHRPHSVGRHRDQCDTTIWTQGG